MTRADHPEFREVSEDMLVDKRSMCEEYLKLLDKVEPGMTKMRGGLRDIIYFSGSKYLLMILQFLHDRCGNFHLRIFPQDFLENSFKSSNNFFLRSKDCRDNNPA